MTATMKPSTLHAWKLLNGRKYHITGTVENANGTITITYVKQERP